MNLPSRVGERCGTYAGWNRHHRERSKVCPLCLEAQRAYKRDLAQRNPDKAERSRASARARQRALARLASEYPARYDYWLTQELTKEFL